MSAHFAQMKVGDKLLIDNKSMGFFTSDRIPQGKEIVMLATGSGIAPFLSMLSRNDLWQQAEKVVLVHSVSYQQDLVFTEHFERLCQNPLVAQKFVYQPVITRETVAGALQQRIPALLKSGELAKVLNFPFTKEHTRFLICGNPTMVKESYETLKEQGFTLHRVHKDGEIMMEHAF